jgi:putative membrane protein
VIVRDRPPGWRLFFIVRGSVLPRIQVALALNLAIAVFAVVTHGNLLNETITLTPIPFTLIGLALAIFLGFRNSVAYDRFWEGRRLWGDLIYESRTLARQCRSLIDAQDPAHWDAGLADVRVRMIRRAIAYAHALRDHLRDGAGSTGMQQQMLSDEEWAAMERVSGKTDFLLHRMGDDLALCRREGRIDSCLSLAIDGTLTAMARIAAGCERIKTTPIPFSYTLLLHRTAYVYCFLLPFGLVDTIGFMTPLVVIVVAYTFFGLDALGDELAEPFGTSRNDLPLDALCRTIEISLLEALEAPSIPPRLMPVDHIVL